MSHDEFESALLQAKNGEYLVELYKKTKNGHEELEVGIVLSVDEENVEFRAISPHGADDGVRNLLTNSLVRIEIDTRYLRQLELFRKHYSVTQSTVSEIPECDVNASLLGRAKAEEKFVCMKTISADEENSVQGYVTELSSEILALKRITDDGNLDGTSFIRVSDIEEIEIDSVTCVEAALLYENRKSLYE